VSDSKVDISIVIPSYNRADALPITLESLAHQTIMPGYFEVLVVDDGSTDGSTALVASLRQRLPYRLRLLEQAHKRQAAARNLGAKEAEGTLLLFLDSDVIASPALVERHRQLLLDSKGPALVAGARRFWEGACTTHYSQTIHGGAGLEVDQFAGRGMTFQEAHSSNLSMYRRTFLELGGFDEELWAYEDVDFAYRAQKAGVHLLFSREALGFHNHPMTLTQACRQLECYQKFAAFFLHKHPELAGQIRHLVDKAPVHWGSDPPAHVARKGYRRLLANRPLLGMMELVTLALERAHPQPSLLRPLYMQIMSSYMLKGYRQGLREVTDQECIHQE